MSVHEGLSKGREGCGEVAIKNYLSVLSQENGISNVLYRRPPKVALRFRKSKRNEQEGSRAPGALLVACIRKWYYKQRRGTTVSEVNIEDRLTAKDAGSHGHCRHIQQARGPYQAPDITADCSWQAS